MSEKITRKIHEVVRGSADGVTTQGILDFVNDNTKHGTTMNELSPLLSQDRSIHKAGTTTVARLNGCKTKQCIWEWRE